MKLIPQSFEILQYAISPEIIERAGRTCYKSESKITDESSTKFCKALIKSGHESVLEHSLATVKLITSRSILAEITRHRLASFSVESTRYVNYDDMSFILPPALRDYFTLRGPFYYPKVDEPKAMIFVKHCQNTEESYKELKELGAQNDLARQVLSQALKTEIVINANAREWRHIFKQRVLGTTGRPHPEIKELLLPVLEEFNRRSPAIFQDLIEQLG